MNNDFNFAIAVMNGVKIEKKECTRLICSQCDACIEEEGSDIKSVRNILRQAIATKWGTIKIVKGSNHVDDVDIIDIVVCNKCLDKDKKIAKELAK